jgi:aminoglycoside 3-N-acetyltransferase
MYNYRDFIRVLRDLGLSQGSHILIHARLASLGEVTGGAEAVLGALLAVGKTVVAPTFTFSAMITPEVGPSDNGMSYGDATDHNASAQFFHPDLPADPEMGSLAEVLRKAHGASRSDHPLLSFSGIGAVDVLDAQSLEDPLAPIAALAEMDADVILLGVDHTANVSLHHAERLAGRRGFVRWALTPTGVVECPGMPGCSNGFPAIAGRLEGIVRRATLGPVTIESFPLRDLLHVATGWMRIDPRALLCDDETCARCSAVRSSTIEEK